MEGGDEMEEVVGAEPVPGHGSDGAVQGGAGETSSETLTRLRQVVPAWRLLSRPPLRADLQAELQRHVGGADHLAPKYRRKQPAGFEHMIVGALSDKPYGQTFTAQGQGARAGRPASRHHQRPVRTLAHKSKGGRRVRLHRHSMLPAVLRVVCGRVFRRHR